jgi:Fe-Mn family superoxide dismutase
LRGKDIGRSTVLALRARGLDARYIVGGIEAWRAAGLPLETQGGSTMKWITRERPKIDRIACPG